LGLQVYYGYVDESFGYDDDAGGLEAEIEGLAGARCRRRPLNGDVRTPGLNITWIIVRAHRGTACLEILVLKYPVMFVVINFAIT
jgi:hypothetical protein